MNKIIATDDTIHQILRDEIARLGNDADLNHIDTSQVTNMRKLFAGIFFLGDISEWDVSNVAHIRPEGWVKWNEEHQLMRELFLDF